MKRLTLLVLVASCCLSMAAQRVVGSVGNDTSIPPIRHTSNKIKRQTFGFTPTGFVYRF